MDNKQVSSDKLLHLLAYCWKIASLNSMGKLLNVIGTKFAAPNAIIFSMADLDTKNICNFEEKLVIQWMFINHKFFILEYGGRSFKTFIEKSDIFLIYYVGNKLKELHLLLVCDKQHSKAFFDLPVIEFCNGKSFKNFLVRAALLKTIETRKAV